jgi:hypothetical protein
MRASRPPASECRSRTLPIWRFDDGKVVEISTIQYRFVLLKQAGHLSGDVYAA